MNRNNVNWRPPTVAHENPLKDYQILVWHHTMAFFIPLNLCGEATDPHTHFTLIHVDSYAALDLYNTWLLGNSGLLRLRWCPSSPTQVVRSSAHASQWQHSLIPMENVHDVTQNPSAPDRSTEVTKDEFSCQDSPSKEVIETAAAYGKGFCSTWGAKACTRSHAFLAP